ncbi:unnamed protein product [Rhizoctonia solani]|uniref:F-box domain-containing protein n=1 Tax=Rhizoctonia solani TaxID=456999 RepID=A0A8H3CW98_9AGAM|nr:unnamed protein product [Rhizoctonia solani]
MQLETKLPIEILDLIVHYSTTDTRAHLSAVSQNAYTVSVRTLYASIPEMSITRTSQCLLTLSMRPDLARLVRSYCFYISPCRRILQAFSPLLSYALSNMKNLRTLSLDVNEDTTIQLLEQVSSRLTKLALSIPDKSSYPISQFLSNQPTIEELLLVCGLEDLSTLDTEALPLLRDLTAPLHVLSKLLPSRLSHMSQVSVLGIMTSQAKLVLLATILGQSNPPESLALIINVKYTAVPTAISQGLRFLGQMAPFVSLLLLRKYGGDIKPSKLRDMFISVLPSFPNLKHLVLDSRPPSSSAYIRNARTQTQDETQPIQTFSKALISDKTAVSLFQMLSNTGGMTSAFLARHSAPFEPNRMQNQPTSSLDVFYDRSRLLHIVKAWRRVHPGLEWVVFPVGVYSLRKSGDD